MITEDYCSPEVSKILKEKGLDKEHFRHYVQVRNGDGTIDAVSVCTHQIAMKWLREKHNVHIVIEYYEVDGEGFYGWIVKTCGERYHCHQAFSKSYEQAVEAAIKYSLENLI